MDKQKLLSKYGKLFASTDKSQAVYQGIYYRADGSAVVTNRHYCLRIREAHSLPQPIILHAKTGQPIEGKFQDVDRAFPTSFENEIPFKRDQLKDVLLRAGCAADIATRIEKKLPIVTIAIENGVARLHIRNDTHHIQFSCFFGNTMKVSSSLHTLNADYLYTALSVFADAGSDVRIMLKDRSDPILLTNERDIDVLILPFRMPY